MTFFTRHFLNLPPSLHQLLSASSTFTATPFPHLSNTAACPTPPPPSTHPCAPLLSPLFLFHQRSLRSPSLLSPHPLPPSAPCFEPGLESVHPEVCHWADGLISCWGNALRRSERGQGPGPGSSARTCCLHKKLGEAGAPQTLSYLN